jgi:hypothetical protein
MYFILKIYASTLIGFIIRTGGFNTQAPFREVKKVLNSECDTLREQHTYRRNTFVIPCRRTRVPDQGPYTGPFRTAAVILTL